MKGRRFNWPGAAVVVVLGGIALSLAQGFKHNNIREMSPAETQLFWIGLIPVGILVAYGLVVILFNFFFPEVENKGKTDETGNHWEDFPH